MDVLLIMITSFVGYIIMYRIYGKFIAQKIFKLKSDINVPSLEFEDGIDYCPTKKEIIFGHHFTSIAGTGPIVGPAIAVIWGWLPALIWVFLGSIFIGAVHDFGSLIISMRNQGKSISEYTAKYINNRTKILFFLIVFLELWIVIAIFGLVIAVIFSMFPSSVFPVWFEIPIAFLLGYMIYNKGKNVTLWSILAIIVMYFTVIIGYYIPLNMPELFGIPATGVWTIVLLIYAFIASVLPVTKLLQPRDFINSHQLIIAMTLLIIGVLASALFCNLEVVAPVVQAAPKDAPPLWPFLFITIACGAVSGFHSLVSSGTSSKQVKCEMDSLFVGYGSMLMEGSLAILVIIAVVAGIGLGYKGSIGIEAWNTHYSSWMVAKGLGSKISAFVIGSANMMSSVGIPHGIAVTIMGVFVASFAGTTLDTSTRIQRYVITELFIGQEGTLKKAYNFKLLKYILLAFKNRYFATFLAITTAAILAFTSGANGKGALTLWPLFGVVNQTLAALALVIITLYLKKKGGLKWLISGIPALFMIIFTTWAIIENQLHFLKSQNILLQVVNFIIFIIVIWIIIEALIQLLKKNDNQ